MKPSFFLGVDILEWKKAEVFYGMHQDRLSEWLSADERKFVSEGKKPHEAFAMVFAAKEAVSKALGLSVSGSEALRNIRLKAKKTGGFLVAGKKSLEITLRRHSQHVVACCHSSDAA